MMKRNMLQLITRSFLSEFCHLLQWIHSFYGMYYINMFAAVHRGDDLGELTETKWPDLYIPKAGLGDLTGTFSSRLLFSLFWC